MAYSRAACAVLIPVFVGLGLESAFKQADAYIFVLIPVFMGLWFEQAPPLLMVEA